ncbi:MAG TPA: hypothetical protein VK861_03800 [Bacteroidales bacterium]|nr:hypothetical protein [Bacteroidales bacterium]
MFLQRHGGVLGTRVVVLGIVVAEDDDAYVFSVACWRCAPPYCLAFAACSASVGAMGMTLRTWAYFVEKMQQKRKLLSYGL